MIDARADAVPTPSGAARCRFCAHVNPDGAKFCNDCGSPLHLRPCALCHAINDVTATRCHVCDAALLLPAEPAVVAVPDGAAPLAEAPASSARPVPVALADDRADAGTGKRAAWRAALVGLAIVALPAAYYALRPARDVAPFDAASVAPRPSATGAAPSAATVMVPREEIPGVPPSGTASNVPTASQVASPAATGATGVMTQSAREPLGGAAPVVGGVPTPPGATAGAMPAPTTPEPPLAARPDSAAMAGATPAPPTAAKRTAAAKSGAKSSGTGRTTGAKTTRKKSSASSATKGKAATRPAAPGTADAASR